MGTPDPIQEIRLCSLHTVRGANFWSRRSVTRLDVAPGAFDEISSAHCPEVTAALAAALPGLAEHRCSIGERGGFLTRLRRGTYAPHIIEHVALELQSLVGHDVGYGKTRGGDAPGEYTVIIEHRHSGVGLRAAALALEIVQHAFAGTLPSVEPALIELRALAELPDLPMAHSHVMCGITGGAGRRAARDEMIARGLDAGDLIVEVAPAYILHAGLPYTSSDFAIVLDTALTDVPARYRDRDRAGTLVSVVADVVIPNGFVITPAGESEVRRRARDAGCRVGVFVIDHDLTTRDEQAAHAVARIDRDRIVLEGGGATVDGGAVRRDTPIAPQLAAALAAFTAQKRAPTRMAVP